MKKYTIELTRAQIIPIIMALNERVARTWGDDYAAARRARYEVARQADDQNGEKSREFYNMYE